jgi:hypothetical protein
LPDEEKYDVIPEFWQGHNIADYIDPDIFKKLEELEKEEEMREKAGAYDSEESEEVSTLCLCAGLPDGFFSDQKSQLGYILEDNGMKNAVMDSNHLEYFTPIRYTYCMGIW